MLYLCVRAHARFACLSSDWATSAGKLLGPATCQPHEDGGIPLSILPKVTTSELAGLFSTSSLCASSSFGRVPYFQMLAVMVLSQHRLSTSKTVSPRIPVGARCTGHVRMMCSAVCSAAPHSQFDVGARPHLCMND